MIHDIDIILSLVKSEVKSISASGVAVMTDTPDIASVRIEFNNGCVRRQSHLQPHLDETDAQDAPVSERCLYWYRFPE